MSERTAYRWEYGIEVTTPDTGTEVSWDQTQYPKSLSDMRLQVREIQALYKRAGSASVSRVRLLRRKRWTKIITTFDAPEVVAP
jgi:hypothetical protein